MVLDGTGIVDKNEQADPELDAKLHRIHLVAAAFGLAWLVASVAFLYWASDYIIAERFSRTLSEADKNTSELTENIDRVFDGLSAIPQVLSTNRNIHSIVNRYNAIAAFGSDTAEARNQALTGDETILRASNRLSRIRIALDFDLVYVLDRRGVRIVSSDWGLEPALLGIDLSDREYFKDAMAGKPGHMFAVSRVTETPSFFFSGPIEEESGPIGAVVVRQSSAKVGALLRGSQRDAMVVDERGMVIASSRPALYLRHVGPLVPAKPEASAVRDVYGLSELVALDVSPPAELLHPSAWRVEGRPVFVTATHLSNTPYYLFQLTPLDWIAEQKTLHRTIGALAFLIGTLLILLAHRGAVSLARRRHFTRVTSALNAKLATANKEKDRYLGIAAHDLRNPLSSMRGLSEMMIEGELEPEMQREFIETIHRTSDEMLVMVNDLLDVAVIESGRLELRYKDQDVAKLLQQRIRHQEPNAKAKDIALKVEAPGVLQARIDAPRFSQVIDNLVSNAIKFSPRGTTVRIALKGDTRGFTFDVKDEGPGMSEEDRKLLFRSFQKLSARPTAGEKSTGLGLAIVKKIVDAHGGTIEVQSAPGRGTRFTVSIPLATAQGDPA